MHQSKTWKIKVYDGSIAEDLILVGF